MTSFREAFADKDLCSAVELREMIIRAVALVELQGDDARRAIATNLRMVAATAEPGEKPVLMAFAEYLESTD